jgi:hypothetical protein
MLLARRLAPFSARIFGAAHSSGQMAGINLLQRGVKAARRRSNRFNGFRHCIQTVETVLRLSPLANTPLKQGVKKNPRPYASLLRVGGLESRLAFLGHGEVRSETTDL